VCAMAIMSIFLLSSSGVMVMAATDFSREGWGSYYDPQGEFCGEYDCYKILGLNEWDEYNTFRYSLKEITKAYRSLSREWHPDKNRSTYAMDKFIKIAKAHEILSDKNRREEYEFLRGRPEEYVKKYGSNVIWNYAPKSNAVFVVIFLAVVFSFLMWFMQMQHWQTIANALIKAAVEDLNAQNGGSRESIEIREKAQLEYDNEQKAALELINNVQGSDGSSSISNAKKSKSKKKKVSTKEKALMNEELRPIIVRMVNEIDDFGGGYRKPQWPKDVFALRLVLLPYDIVVKAMWMMKYFARRMKGEPLNDEELEYRTIATIGIVAWDAASTQDQAEMKKRHLWLPGKLEEWEEYLETRHFSAGDMKRYNRWKKKQTISKGD